VAEGERAHVVGHEPGEHRARLRAAEQPQVARRMVDEQRARAQGGVLGAGSP
jgi:hypothetical protein